MLIRVSPGQVSPNGCHYCVTYLPTSSMHAHTANSRRIPPRGHFCCEVMTETTGYLSPLFANLRPRTPSFSSHSLHRGHRQPPSAPASHCLQRPLGGSLGTNQRLSTAIVVPLAHSPSGVAEDLETFEWHPRPSGDLCLGLRSQTRPRSLDRLSVSCTFSLGGQEATTESPVRSSFDAHLARLDLPL